MGDSLMYSLLPLEAENLRIPLPLIGVLLSANRLIRLLSNLWASNLFERFGPRLPFLAASVLSLITTALYGLGWGFLLFLIARMLWGIAWSGLRQGGFVAIWRGDEASKGRLTGLLWGLVRLGSAVSVVAGGFVYDRFGFAPTIVLIASITALAIPLAVWLPWTHASVATSTPATFVRARFGDWRQHLNRPIHRWLIAAGACEHIAQGVILSTTSLFLAQRISAEGLRFGPLLGAGSLAGLMLGARWASDLLFAPLFGALSDRLGQANAAMGISIVYLLAVVGVVSLPIELAVVALLVNFLCAGGLYVTLTAAASGAANASTRPHLFIAAFTTGGDAGSALGPLLAFSLVTYVGFPLLYLAMGLLLVLVVWGYWRFRLEL